MGVVKKIGIAEMCVTTYPDKIATIGLGSCIGVVLYDKYTKIGGMLHIMLPDSSKINNNSNKLKFADTGIDEFVSLIVSKGANKNSLVAKIAGGATLFKMSKDNTLDSVGARNTLAVRKQLKLHNIPIIAEDVGEDYGRTIEVDLADGQLMVRAVGKGIRYI